MIKNKEQFKDNKKVYDLLNSLEKYIDEKEPLAISVILTRLKTFNITLEVDEHGSEVLQSPLQ